MKKIFLVCAMIWLGQSQAQVKQDQNGNLYEVAKTVEVHDSTTNKTFTTAKGDVYNVYKGKKGAYYIWRTSKAGKQYKQYLKLEE